MSAVKSVLRLLLVIGVFSAFITRLTAMEESSSIKNDLLLQKVKKYIARGCPHFDAFKELLDFSEKTEQSIYEKLIFNANKSSYDSCFNSVVPLSYAVDVGDEKIVELLLLAGAHVDGMSEEIDVIGNKSNDFPLDRAPIFHAIDHEKPKILEILCKYGANVYRKHKRGGTPLHYVILHQSGYWFTREYVFSGQDKGNLEISLAMIKILLKYGADVTLKARVGGSRYDHKPAVTTYELARKEGLPKICDCLSSHPRDNILSTLGNVWSETLVGMNKPICEKSPDELKIEELSIAEEPDGKESEFINWLKGHPGNTCDLSYSFINEAIESGLLTKSECIDINYFYGNTNSCKIFYEFFLSDEINQVRAKFPYFLNSESTKEEKKALFLLKQYFFYFYKEDDIFRYPTPACLVEKNIGSYFILNQTKENGARLFYFVRLAINTKIPLLVRILLYACFGFSDKFLNRESLLKTKDGKGILHEAVKAGNLQILMMLIMFFKNYTARNNNGQTPLQYAKLLGKKRIVQLLMLVEKYLGEKYNKDFKYKKD